MRGNGEPVRSVVKIAIVLMGSFPDVLPQLTLGTTNVKVRVKNSKGLRVTVTKLPRGLGRVDTSVPLKHRRLAGGP